MVQLGVWIAAEFRKRELCGFDARMPVLAVEIKEDAWQLYVAFDATCPGEKKVITFAGAVAIGDTKTEQGAFKLLHVLSGLAHWADTKYRLWFEREVLAKYLA